MADVFLNPGYSTMWAALGAIAQGIASILAIAALLYSMTTFRRSLKTSHYTELDRMYFDLLKLAVEKSHLGNPKSSRTDEQKAEYEVYAYMVWNFLETIYDRCARDEHLCVTWYPVVDAENRLHREWFDRADNKHKFKQEFHDFIRSSNYKCQ